jgi:GT2 family glycosyltransferase
MALSREAIMLLTISVLFYGRADVSKKFLDVLGNTIGERNDIEVIVTSNGSPDREKSEKMLSECRIQNLLYIPIGVNIGFPAGHNNALNYAQGEYFLVLNNDMIFKDPDWIDKLIAPFRKDPPPNLVGLKGTPCSIKVDGNGFVGPKVEYIEGSCLMGRTDVLKTYGLFSDSLDMFFYEDSDMGLRYLEMGMKLETVLIAHDHIRGQSLTLISKPEIEKHRNKNGEIFKKRWGRYLTSRHFTNRILIKMNSLGIGDVLCMTPALAALRKDHPTAIIEVDTPFRDVFRNNPNYNSFFTPGPKKIAYDRIIDVQPNYGSHDLLGKEVEKFVGSKFNSYLPDVYLLGDELEGARRTIDGLREKDSPIVGVSLLMSRVEWEGRNWNVTHASDLILELQESGAKVIEFGKSVPSTGLADLDLVDKLELREFFAFVANLDMFICIDSLGLHVGQAFRVPTYALMGATEPISRIVDFSRTFIVRNEELPCLGCYAKKGDPGFNKCALGTEACMQDLTPERVMSYLTGDINGLQHNIHYLQSRIRDNA